ncbi:MerR family transcriptional regulator [Streptomyces sp. GC420]|nr:MerR family transcriptional regulator [Streptomyces sp. GC420]
MRIGELARRTAVSERSLRYYEQQGLLTAGRTPGGHRSYPESAVDRVVRIQELLAAGLCSSKIAELLPCIRDADGGPSAAATPLLVTELTRARARIDGMIADLRRAREVLDGVIEAASSERPLPGRDAPGPGQPGSGQPGSGAAPPALSVSAPRREAGTPAALR